MRQGAPRNHQYSSEPLTGIISESRLDQSRVFSVWT
jgi:hypothetical protein